MKGDGVSIEINAYMRGIIEIKIIFFFKNIKNYLMIIFSFCDKKEK